MTLTGSQLFLLYLCLFLGIVFILWMVGGWKASRQARQGMERVPCPICGFLNPRGHAWVSLRCSKCGARRHLNPPDPERSS